MRARIRDTELYFDVEGCGLVPDGRQMREKPVAFIIHGGPGADHSSFKPTLSPLSQEMQLVYFDHRGQGRSARGPKETYTLDNNVEDMEALRQYLGLDKIVVIGFSYGGMVALSYALRYSEHLSHLIVAVTAPDARFLEKAQKTLAQRGTEAQKAIAQYLWQGCFESEAQLQEYFHLLGPLYSLTYNFDTPPESASRTILSVDAINQAFGGFLRSYNILDQLHTISVPTLVIGAEQDWICAPEFSEDIANAIPNSQLVILQNSGHSVRADAPEALVESITQFILPSSATLQGNPRG